MESSTLTAKVQISLANFLTTFGLFYTNLEYFSPFVLRSESLVECEFLKIRKITQKQTHLTYLEKVELALDDGDRTINFTKFPQTNDFDYYILHYSSKAASLTITSPKFPLKVLQKVLTKFIKIALNPTYQKRVHHDLVIPKATFQDLYFTLKQVHLLINT